MREMGKGNIRNLYQHNILNIILERAWGSSYGPCGTACLLECIMLGCVTAGGAALPTRSMSMRLIAFRAYDPPNDSRLRDSSSSHGYEVRWIAPWSMLLNSSRVRGWHGEPNHSLRLLGMFLPHLNKRQVMKQNPSNIVQGPTSVTILLLPND